MDPSRVSSGLWRGFGEAWTLLSYLITGIALWGGVGYGLDRLFGTEPVLFVIGVLTGNFGGIYLIYLRTMGESERRAP